MTGDESRFELSRRKILGGVSAVGAAGALGGVGTSAFLNDQERFNNNSLAAGKLDMKAAYSAHYSDWSSDEDESVSVRMWSGDPGTTGSVSDLNDGETGLPTRDAWLVAVTDPDQFLANTQYNEAGVASCPAGTDATEIDQPVINISDIKPGDFGEVTLDFTLCDNPGFLWMRGSIESAKENGTTEPEADDEDEESGIVELLDVVQAAAWVDDGDNYQESDENIAIIGSLREVLNEFGTTKGLSVAGDIAAKAGGGTGQNCFSSEIAHAIGFAWWVPIDHGNEIQTDSVTISLGLYTEQCRHNSVSAGIEGFKTFASTTANFATEGDSFIIEANGRGMGEEA